VNAISEQDRINQAKLGLDQDGNPLPEFIVPQTNLPAKKKKKFKKKKKLA
jgi:hypothetical protein